VIGLVICANCCRDAGIAMVVTMGSVVVLMVVWEFCRTGCVEGGRGSWSGVNLPKLGGKGGGFTSCGVDFGVGASGIGESAVLVWGGGVMNSRP
jgi:hypothetical protein